MQVIVYLVFALLMYFPFLLNAMNRPLPLITYSEYSKIDHTTYGKKDLPTGLLWKSPIPPKKDQLTMSTLDKFLRQPSDDIPFNPPNKYILYIKNTITPHRIKNLYYLSMLSLGTAQLLTSINDAALPLFVENTCALHDNYPNYVQSIGEVLLMGSIVLAHIRMIAGAIECLKF